MKQGFTLLELLVVIAIIGLLASIILVSYEGSTDKAKIAKTLSWAGSISHLLGANAVGVWTFDRISGPTVYDESGNGNDGTISGAVQIDGVVGKALEFNSADVVIVNNSPSLNNYDALTLVAWIKPTIDGGYDGIIDKYYYPGACYQRQFLFGRWPTNRICFWMGYNDGASAVSVCTPTDSSLVKDGWTHVAATWSEASNTMKVYINGTEKASYTNALNWTTNTACNLQIGRYYLNSSYVFNGLIDDVRIYSEALPQARIEQLYADGLPTHQPLALEILP